jgi:hypothetical protein
MLKLIDSGCGQHPERHPTLTGLAAALVGRLILNLPLSDAGYTYICELGHTHCLTLQPRRGKVATDQPQLGLTGSTALNH